MTFGAVANDQWGNFFCKRRLLRRDRLKWQKKNCPTVSFHERGVLRTARNAMDGKGNRSPLSLCFEAIEMFSSTNENTVVQYHRCCDELLFQIVLADQFKSVFLNGTTENRAVFSDEIKQIPSENGRCIITISLFRK